MKIQALWRRYVVRRAVVRRLAFEYHKYYDTDSGSSYWVNAVTQECRWTRPALLWTEDAVGPQRVRPTAAEDFVVMCSYCSQTLATVTCNRCVIPSCEACYLEEHEVFRDTPIEMAVHSTSPVRICSECSHQVSCSDQTNLLHLVYL